jgi:hypothetical protein
MYHGTGGGGSMQPPDQKNVSHMANRLLFYSAHALPLKCNAGILDVWVCTGIGYERIDVHL